MGLKTVVFHGPSGSGKDTQLDLLEKDYDFMRIGGSAIKDQLLQEGHPLAIKADEYGKRGERYPDEVMYGMLEEWLADKDKNARWFFVSPVRKDTQVELFDDLLTKFDRQLDLFVHFTLSVDAAIERMAQRWFCPVCNTTYHKQYKKEKVDGICDNDGTPLMQRADDTPDGVRKRLEWYKSDLDPILHAYRSRGVLLEIDAAPSIEEIHTELLSQLKRYE